MNRFRLVADGVEVHLDESEIAVLGRLGSLFSAAGVTEKDPATERLSPKVYPNDASASREFDRLANKERVESRSADRELFTKGISTARSGTCVLDSDEAAVWARVIGESRLVLAARGGVFEDGWPDDPTNRPEVAFSMFLGQLLEELIDQMLASMEDAR